MLEEYGIPYTLIYIDEITASKYLSEGKRPVPGYQRVFLGDVFSVEMKMVAASCAADGAALVYLDDGNSMIQTLKHNDTGLFSKRLFQINGFNWRFWRHRATRYLKLSKYCFQHKLFIHQNFFTIFPDLVPSKAYSYSNRLNLLRSRYNCGLSNDVMFIGCPVRILCGRTGIDENLLYSKLAQKLADIKAEYPGCRMMYIPHGRESDERADEICKSLGIEYRPISEAIEFYAVRNHIAPCCIYGINSTALLTLKTILPQANVTNIIVGEKGNAFHHFLEEVADYYSTKGIAKEVLHID